MLTEYYVLLLVLQQSFDFLQQSTLDRKKKNFTFSRKFPFMKSKDDKNEDGSDQERKLFRCKISIIFPIVLD